MYMYIMLDPSMQVAKNPKSHYVCGEGPSKNLYLHV
jgi:hypothetical protein